MVPLKLLTIQDKCESTLLQIKQRLLPAHMVNRPVATTPTMAQIPAIVKYTETKTIKLIK
jgi:hypothetical protein